MRVCERSNNNYLVHCFTVMYPFKIIVTCLCFIIFYSLFYKYLFYISVIYQVIVCREYVSKC